MPILVTTTGILFVVGAEFMGLAAVVLLIVLLGVAILLKKDELAREADDERRDRLRREQEAESLAVMSAREILQRKVDFVRRAAPAQAKGLVTVQQIAIDAGLTVTETARVLELAMRRTIGPTPTTINVDTRCGVCGEKPEIPIVVCPSCGAAHHELCWAYNDGKCSRFGCAPS